MARTVLEAMKADIVSKLKELSLLSISEGENLNKETGEVTKFI